MCYQALGIPCFLGGMARGLLGRNSNLHIRQRRRDALKEADLVILAGTCMVRNNKERNTDSKKIVCDFAYSSVWCWFRKVHTQIKTQIGKG